MATFSIILESDVSASLLMKMKKLTDLPLAELKSRITNKTPLMAVDRRNKEKMESMKELVKELSSHQVSFQIFKQTSAGREELTFEMFMNSLDLTRQIAEDLERLDAQMVEEDE